MSVSAQRYKKVESKAKTYAEKYERVGNEIAISFVAEDIPMSKMEIYSAFPDLLDKQFKIHDDDIESRDALSKVVKCSLLRKLLDTAGSVVIKSNFDIKLSAKDGKARISIKTNGYGHYRGSNMMAEENVCSRPPFVDLDSNSEKGAKLVEFYYDTFLQLDKQVESIIESFNEYWQKQKK
jgi:hypothetical protein